MKTLAYAHIILYNTYYVCTFERCHFRSNVHTYVCIIFTLFRVVRHSFNMESRKQIIQTLREFYSCLFLIARLRYALMNYSYAQFGWLNYASFKFFQHIGKWYNFFVPSYLMYVFGSRSLNMSTNYEFGRLNKLSTWEGYFFNKIIEIFHFWIKLYCIFTAFITGLKKCYKNNIKARRASAHYVHLAVHRAFCVFLPRIILQSINNKLSERVFFEIIKGIKKERKQKQKY